MCVKERSKMVSSTQPKKFVAYYRVSTQRQGRSGLGLEAQQQMVRQFVSACGGQLMQELEEVESGKKTHNRPKLKEAMALCRKRGIKATLIVAKLDRLARQQSFVSVMLDTPGIEFVACDMPEANKLMLQIMSAVAEYEGKLISDRTKAALAARKARGMTLGNPNNFLINGTPAPEANRVKAREEAERLRPVVEAMKAQGITTIKAITQELNQRGYKTTKGLAFHPTTTARVLARLKTAAA